MSADEKAFAAAAAIYERGRKKLATRAEAMEDAVQSMIAAGLVRQRRAYRPFDWVHAIIARVAQAHNVGAVQLTREGHCCPAMSAVRDEAVYLIRAIGGDGGPSYLDLGARFHRDHSTLIQGQRKFEARLATDNILRRRIEAIVRPQRQQQEAA